MRLPALTLLLSLHAAALTPRPAARISRTRVASDYLSGVEAAPPAAAEVAEPETAPVEAEAPVEAAAAPEPPAAPITLSESVIADFQSRSERNLEAGRGVDLRFLRRGFDASTSPR